jgi:hypothetical protein
MTLKLRSRIRNAIKGYSKSARTLELLGCNAEQVQVHLESQFVDGMSWSNRQKWEIDHIVPFDIFDMDKPSHQKVACNWKNIQPLWEADNIAKGSKIVPTMITSRPLLVKMIKELCDEDEDFKNRLITKLEDIRI